MKPHAIPGFLLVVLILGFTQVGCGDDEPESGATAEDVSLESETTPEGGGEGEAGVASEGEGEGDASGPDIALSEPRVRVPDGKPPRRLRVKDVSEGDGPEVAAGDRVLVHYVGVGYSDGEKFDASWDREEPFAFQLGAGMVIPGWDEGIEGMRVGGRRRLTIPPRLAYGSQGAPPVIGANETLVFVIDLLEIQ